MKKKLCLYQKSILTVLVVAGRLSAGMHAQNELPYDANAQKLADLANDPLITGVSYCVDGYLSGETLTVQSGGLGCSAYAAILLYKMVYGAGWKKAYQKDWMEKNIRVYKYSGTTIAKMFGLPRTYKRMPIIAFKRKIKWHRIKPGSYFFALDKEIDGKKHGHVGFITLKKNNKIIVNEVTLYDPDNAPYIGEFFVWLEKTMYKDGFIYLWDASKPKAPQRAPDSHYALYV